MHSLQIVPRADQRPFRIDLFMASQVKLPKSKHALDNSKAGLDRRLSLSIDLTAGLRLQSMSHLLNVVGAWLQSWRLIETREPLVVLLAAVRDVWGHSSSDNALNVRGAKVAGIGQDFGHLADLLRQRLERFEHGSKQVVIRRCWTREGAYHYATLCVHRALRVIRLHETRARKHDARFRIG